ncbi:MAG: DUF2277 family protein [Coriobacteriia bacterium]
MSKPSVANEAAFSRAVDEVAQATTRLVESLVTAAPPRNRAEELAKAHERARLRFGDA